MHVDPSNATEIVKACCVLHNMCLEYQVSSTGQERANQENVPTPVGAAGVRENFKKLFNDFPVSWQDSYIDR